MPIIAQDFHQQNIANVVKNALKDATMTVEDVDAIAVTSRPGEGHRSFIFTLLFLNIILKSNFS